MRNGQVIRYSYVIRVPLDHGWRKRDQEIINFRLQELVRSKVPLPQAKSILEDVFGIKFY